MTVNRCASTPMVDLIVLVHNTFYMSQSGDKLFILCLVYSTVVLNTQKNPTGTHFSSTIDHGVSEMVSLIVQYRRAPSA